MDEKLKEKLQTAREDLREIRENISAILYEESLDGNNIKFKDLSKAEKIALVGIYTVTENCLRTIAHYLDWFE